MFWSADIFTSKKHGIAVCWLAATLGPRGAVKKLTKKDYTNVKIPNACDYLESPPDGPIPLRLTSNLLVGVARVYSQQWSIYLADVNNVFLAIRKAYGSKSTAADGTNNIDMAVPEARPDAITVAINEDEFTNGPFDVSLRIGGREMNWLAIMEEDFESIQPLSSQQENSFQGGTKAAKSQTSYTAGEGPQSAMKSRTGNGKSLGTKDSITLNERSILEDLPGRWSQHDAAFQDDLGAEGALDFGFADDELLLANQRRVPSVNMDDVADEVLRDHAEAAKSRKRREPRMIVNEEEQEQPQQEELPEEEQALPVPSPVNLEEFINQDLMEYGQDIPAAPLPSPPPPHEEDEFFFKEREVLEEATTQKKKSRKRKDSNSETEETDVEGQSKVKKPFKAKNTKKHAKRMPLMDASVELTNDDMRSMIESGNRSNDETWRERRLGETEDEKQKNLQSFLTRPVMMKAPRLIKFYQVITHRNRWGHIPTEPRRNLPVVAHSLDQGVASVSDHLSERLRPLANADGSASSYSAYRSFGQLGARGDDQPQGDELFAEQQEQDVEVGRDRPPTPQSDLRGRVRSHSHTSDLFPWHNQARAQSHSRTGSQHSPRGDSTGLYQKYGGVRSSASFMTLEDQQKGAQAGGLGTPEVDRFGRRRGSGLWGHAQEFSPLADLPIGDADTGGIFFPINDEASKGGTSTNMADDSSSKVAAALEKDSGAFLNYAMDIMNRAQTNHVHFFDLVPPKVSSRAAASRAFYHVLTLANRKIITASQDEPYGDIRLDKM
ncbi:hypothetical protein SeMB42_g06137 [Synchytrium endobioticum]|uniref:Rad21/Rec8-like protein N-terminal domain-containing protein n=1 Tax=Synchytrium endobioticum TaxID=286115 RepID=A0A507CF46_9FUNG|nr:hypothetical protein SeMB42_g06137 [Synchytrium endobioticum]TPX42087.1 hypothetical protein SeLEV6574_g05768 [Synchytrium endobioticum]